MLRQSIHKLLVAGLAVAALTASGAPAQAAETSAPVAMAQGWCDHVPLFCDRRCGTQARCQPGPM